MSKRISVPYKQLENLTIVTRNTGFETLSCGISFHLYNLSISLKLHFRETKTLRNAIYRFSRAGLDDVGSLYIDRSTTYV